jgi:thioredoxin reductase (NADPH)
METIGRNLDEMQRVPLTPAHVEALRAAGMPATYAAGTNIVQPGDPVDCFVYVDEGEIEVVDAFSGKRYGSSTLGPNQFMAEISILSGGVWTMPMRAAGRVMRQPSIVIPSSAAANANLATTRP